MSRGSFGKFTPSFPRLSFDSIMCKGGMDETTPSLTLPNGFVRTAMNFSCAVSGGYERVYGYERFDGHPSPTVSSAVLTYLVLSEMQNPVSVGDIITVSATGASGVVSEISGLRICLAKVTGVFSIGDTLSVGGLDIGLLIDDDATPNNQKEPAVSSATLANIYRADISAPPGSGPVRGVVMFDDIVYAFRNNAGGTACDIYKSSATGWVNVPLLKTVSFTLGNVAIPSDGATLTQGGVTATIRRVVRTSGAWTGTAAGQLIIDTPVGGNFSAASATIGTTTLTLSGIHTQLALLPGGKFEFDESNFYGSVTTNRIYGCDGVNKAFEFDGTILVPIRTNATPDTPKHIVAHRNYLWLSINSSIFYSGPGLPYDYSALSGAGEIATGDIVSGMVSMPGGTTTGTLGVFSRSNTNVLYGNSSSSFNMVSFNTGSGCIPYSAQNMAQTLVFDDRGAQGIQTALQYGNFAQSTFTANIVPFVSAKSNLLTCSMLNRTSSQYRTFFSDGTGLYITIVNGKLVGSMPVTFPDSFFCAFNGKMSTGVEVNFVGADNGYVYQLEMGSSCDGEPMDYFFLTNYSSAKSPRITKRYRKAEVEIFSPLSTYAEFSVGYNLGYSSAERAQQGDYDSYGKRLESGFWDQYVWDNAYWDGSGTEPISCELSGSAENISLSINGSADYVMPFIVNSIIIHYSPRRVMR